MFEMKILAPALAALAALVWGVVLLQEDSVPAAVPAPAAEVPAPAASVAMLDSSPALAPAPQGRLMRGQRSEVQPPLRNDDNTWAAPSADDPARAAWQATHPLGQHRLDKGINAEAMSYRQRWRQLPAADRRALRQACAHRGLDRQDMQCLQLVDSSGNIPAAPRRQQQRRPGYGTPPERDHQRGQPPEPQPSGAEPDTIQ